VLKRRIPTAPLDNPYFADLNYQRKIGRGPEMSAYVGSGKKRYSYLTCRLLVWAKS